jgi:chemotaxis protein methyltransferase CheR
MPKWACARVAVMLDQAGAGPASVAETHFCRHAEQLHAFVAAALPACLEDHGWRAGVRLQSPLRILSAGCASGEEAYTLALLIHDSFPHLFTEDVQILGIDAQPALLQRARHRRYSEWSFRQTPPNFRKRHFRQDGGAFVIPLDQATNVRFEERDLLEEDLLFYRHDSFDIIFCRNVVMYFTPEVAAGVIERLGRALRPSGFLFLGAAETLRGISNAFELCQSNDAFYYRPRSDVAFRAAGGETGRRRADRVDPGIPSSVTDTPAAPLPMLLDPDWLQTIMRASARIEALADRTDRTMLARSVTAPPPLRDPRAVLGHALALAETGALAEAARLCRDASELDPEFAMPHLHLALLAKTKGDRDQARSEFAQALDLLAHEEPSRIVRFGGGFTRETLIRLCRAEMSSRATDRAP